jgi:hypothetical protein
VNFSLTGKIWSPLVLKQVNGTVGPFLRLPTVLPDRHLCVNQCLVHAVEVLIYLSIAATLMGHTKLEGIQCIMLLRYYKGSRNKHLRVMVVSTFKVLV